MVDVVLWPDHILQRPFRDRSNRGAGGTGSRERTFEQPTSSLRDRYVVDLQSNSIQIVKQTSTATFSWATRLLLIIVAFLFPLGFGTFVVAAVGGYDSVATAAAFAITITLILFLGALIKAGKEKGAIA